MTRLRVLLSTHEFSPYQGSECSIGWNIATRLAEYHDVTVLCADGPPLRPNSYRSAVEHYFRSHKGPASMRVVFVEQPRSTERVARINRVLMKLTRGIGWQPLHYLGLDRWHRRVLAEVSKMNVEQYDVVHQLTPISFLRPGYLWKLRQPFYWGPIGGMYKVPTAFARYGRKSSFLFELARSANIVYQVWRSRSLRSAVRKAERVWTITDEERKVINSLAPRKGVLMLEAAAPAGIRGFVRQYDGKRPLKLCWSGNHEPRKALPLLLHALAKLPDRRTVTLDILGEGSETPMWKHLAERLGLQGVNWHGALPYAEALAHMGPADVFVHTSYREAASLVVLEALGWGLPVVCHDACGMAIAVDETCGKKVPFVDPTASVNGFRDAILQFLRNPPLVEELSRGALRRASKLSWDAKVHDIAESYRGALQANRPSG